MLNVVEVIVVEGRDDMVNLKRFIQGDFILTRGYQLSKDTQNAIVTAAKSRGIIVLTDPDFAGNVIRSRIVKLCKAAQVHTIKHAFISREEGTKAGDIGVENANEEALIRALEGAKVQIGENERVALYTERDLFELGLVGTDASKALRENLGHYLKIGYANGKQFLNRLNAFQVPPEKIAEFFETQVARKEEHK